MNLKYLKYLSLLMLFSLSGIHAAEIKLDVLETIENKGIAQVIINLDVTFDFEPNEEQQARQLRSLKAIEPNPELSKTEKLQRIAQAVAIVQDEVLTAVAHLDETQFKLSIQYGYIAAIVAEIGTDALDILRNHPKVELIQLNAQGSLNLTTAVPLINGDDVHVLTPNSYTGDGISVAVLDTGIDTDHSDFNDSAIVDEKCYVNSKCPPSNDSESNSAEDDNGHGTHVAGIITSPDGIAPDANIVAVKVINNSASFQLADLMSGVDWVVDNLDNISPDIRVMNLSLGLDSRYNDQSECDNVYPSYTSVFNQLANELDVVVFAATGNDGDTTDIDWPSCLSDVIAIGNSDNSDTLYSSGNRGALLEIVAPGVSIVSSQMGGGTVAETGTSMSSPMAAGVAALMLEQDSTLTATLIKQRMIDNGVDISGYSRVDALASIQDTSTQALLQLTQDSNPYQNGETYDLGVFNQNAVISKQFKLFNLGNAALINDSFDLSNDNATLDDSFPTGIAANSSDTFTLSFPTTTEGSFTDSITFNSNDSNNANFSTTLEWLVCDGVLSVSDDFDDPTGCWEREIVSDPSNAFVLDIDTCPFPCGQEEMLSYTSYSSKDTLQFNASQAASYGSTAEGQLTTSSFSTVGSDNINISFDWYERNGTGDADKMTVYWADDGSSWQYLDEFDCQTTNSGWQNKNATLPNNAENQSTVYVRFLFEADSTNYNADDDCFLANVDITADSVPEIALYGNGIEISNNDTVPSTDDGTDFERVEVGSSLGMNFSIANEGLSDLSLTSSPYVELSGTNADQFSISSQPSSSIISANSSETFTVTFEPTNEGEQSAMITVKNDDSDEATYRFLIEGEGTIDPALTLSVIDTEFFEDDGNDVATGTVSRLTSDGDVTVSLMVDDDKVSISPNSLTILDGETESDSFTLSIINDEDYTGDVTVTLTATADDYDGDSVSLTVKEDETEPVLVEEEEEESKGPPPPEPDYIGVFIGSPNGRVISDPEGIDCNRGEGSCWHVFPRIDPDTGRTTQVTLHTIAPEGLYFDRWVGDSDCRDSKLFLNNTKRCLAYFYGIPKQ